LLHRAFSAGIIDLGRPPLGLLKAASSKSESFSQLTGELPAKKYLVLTTAVFVLGKAVPAIHWTVFSGLERNFTLFFAIRTDCFMHLSWTSIISSILKTHFYFSMLIDVCRQ
jgi:hypothetical protein